MIDNHAGLTSGYAVFEFYNPTNLNVNVNTSTFNIFYTKYSGNNITSISFFYAINVTENQNVTDYTNVCKPYNMTDRNGTWSIQNCSQQPSGWHWSNRTYENWIKFTNKTFNSKTYYKIKVEAIWNAHLGDQSIEWFPKVNVNGTNYIQYKWQWWNTSWNKCKNITMSEMNNTARTFEPISVNLTGLTYSSTNEIRIINSSCGNNGNSVEVPYQIISSGGSTPNAWVNLVYEANISASASLWATNTTYSVYYNYTGISAPSYPVIVWNSTAYPNQYAVSNWQTWGGFRQGAGNYPALMTKWIPQSSSSTISTAYGFFYGLDYQTTCTFTNVTGGAVFAEANSICAGTYKINETVRVYKNYKPIYTKWQNTGTVNLNDYFEIAGTGDDLYCYSSDHVLQSRTADSNVDWIFDTCRDGWVQVVSTNTNITIIFNETNITSASNLDYYTNYDSGTLIADFNGVPTTYNNRVFWFYAQDSGFSDSFNVNNIIKSPSSTSLGSETNYTSGTSYFLSVGDSVSFADSNGRTVNVLRISGDSVTFNDFMSKLLNIPRSAGDSIVYTDSDGKRINFPRSVGDMAVFYDSDGKIVNYQRVIGNSVSFADSNGRTVNVLRVAGDTVTLSDLDGRMISIIRVDSDNIQFLDQLFKVLNVLRSSGDNIQFQDQNARILNLLRSDNETIQFADSLSKIINFVRSNTETLTFYDSDGRMIVYKRVNGDNIQLNDYSSRSMNFIRTFGDLVSFFDSSNNKNIFSRNIGDVLAFNDSDGRMIYFKRSVGDTVQLQDLSSKQTNYQRALGDITQFIDGLKAQFNSLRSVGDTMIFSDYIDRMLGIPSNVTTTTITTTTIPTENVCTQVYDFGTYSICITPSGKIITIISAIRWKW